MVKNQNRLIVQFETATQVHIRLKKQECNSITNLQRMKWACPTNFSGDVNSI